MPIEITIQDKKFLVPESNDPCELWVGYFDSLVKAMGTTNARTLWLVTWSTNGSLSCTTNAGFNSWLGKNKIDVSSAATRTIADSAAIGSNFMGLGKNMSKVLSLAVPVTLGVVLVSIGVVLWNTSRKATVSDLAMVTPMGRSGTAALKLLGR